MDTKIGPKSKQKKNVISKLGFLYHIFIENRIPRFYSENMENRLCNNEISLTRTELSSIENNGIYTMSNVPDYLALLIEPEEQGFKSKMVRQYQGYLVYLKDIDDSKAYLAQQLSKRNIKNLFAKQRKLEGSNNISYTFHYGDITKEHYDFLLSEFYDMLEKRFLEKKMYNNNLLHWKYYYDLVYPMILEKRASLFVIYDGKKPITLTLNFHLKDIVFSYIQTYDIDYSNYNMGDISMLKHIEWCKKNDFSIFDLAMGQTDYKLKWCNHIYNYEHHLFYNSQSLFTRIKALILLNELRLRQYLRDKDIIGKRFQMDKFLFKRRVKQLSNFNWHES
ncbi:GNAT family N-acetyltransferase [Arenibacter sp. BSSL-BM3]|uniref:GNAT family N-acetyltransferase n=1 Tax=Arenibacter arenosicollis TaxID=2762274 RepID=A0ABR7QL04_9FLAO|nr:GNAT family N-acetyltransferase [Arenibacter arenosicollis]MBC8767855.1 GNAT family N-acetyltransferase [Arenibacter arenosicollis]